MNAFLSKKNKKDKKDKKLAFLKLFTITVFIMLASIDNSVLDIASSIYWAIEPELGVDAVFLGFANSISIWIVSISAVIWGFIGDRGDRKKLLLLGTAIWVFSIIFTPVIHNGTGWLIIQIISGIGLGCIASIGFSVITDFVSPEKRGLALSFWGMSQGIGTFVGKALGTLLVTDSSKWYLPFIVCSGIGIILIILYYFTLDPKRGGTEAELQDVDYEYNIKFSDLKFILKKPTNLTLMLQGLTAQVVWGSFTWLPYIFTQKLIAQSFSLENAGLVGNLIAGLFSVGGIFSILFGALGDKYQKKTLKARPLIATIGTFAGIVLFIIMIRIPFDISEIASISGTMNIIFAILGQLGTNPLFLIMFICSIASAAAMSANSPNWFALVSDVNLPEHRGTVFGLGNLINGIGRGIGSIVFPLISAAFIARYPDPENYIVTLMVIQLFFIPTGFCYLVACFYVERDIKNVKRIMVERAELAKSKPKK